MALLAQERCGENQCFGSSALPAVVGGEVLTKSLPTQALMTPAYPAKSLTLLGQQYYLSSTPDVILGSLNERTGPSTRLMSVREQGVEMFYVDGDGASSARNYIGTESNPNSNWMGNADAGRNGSFMCPYVTNGSPCVSNPVGIIELYGRMPDVGQSSQDICDVELYGGGGNVTRTAGCIQGVGNGPTSHKIWGVKYNGDTFQDGRVYLDYVGGNETAIQARYAGLQLMGTHPGVNGPDVYFLNGATRAAGNVFEIYNAPSTLLWSIAFDGAMALTSARNKGSCTLDGASPSKCTATVKSGAICICQGVGTSAASAIALAHSVTSTTLTCTGANGLTNVVEYHCL